MRDANVVGVRIFTLELKDVLQRQQPNPYKPAGWRIFAGHPDRALVAGDVAQRDNEFRLVSFTRDPKVANSLEKLNAADNLDAVRGDEVFDLKLLRIPAVLVDALLLTSQSSGKEFCAAIRVPDIALEVMRSFGVEQFFGRLEALANKYLEFNRVEP